MKLTDFLITCRKGDFIFAEATVTTGSLWWKKTTRRTVFRPYGSRLWRFIDTGEFTPDYQAEYWETVSQARRAFAGEN